MKKRTWIMMFVMLFALFSVKGFVKAEEVFQVEGKSRQGQQVSLHIATTYDDDEISGFDIYRTDELNGTYSLIGNMDFRNTYFRDYWDEEAKTYYYDEPYYSDVYTYYYVFWDTEVHELYKTYYYQIKMYTTYIEDVCSVCGCNDIVELPDCECDCHWNGRATIKTEIGVVNVSVLILPDGPVITSAKRSGKLKTKIEWSSITGVDGYLIYGVSDYDSKSNRLYPQLYDESEYSLIKTITSPYINTATFKKLMNGVTYTYRIYGYKEVNGMKMLTVSSEPVSVTMDYYSNDAETYKQKIKRAFGSEKKKEKNFKTATKAAKQMKTIKIKVWDFKNGKKGKKVTRIKYLTVNKRMAPSIKAMFDEIYKAKEKQVIKDIGAYSYRTGEHMYGLAIDINPNENYMIDGKKKLAGSFWNPKKSKYSIPLECETVRIMQRYGFYRGFWGDRKDYMHFSYFGT